MHDGRRPGSDATSTMGMNLKRDAEVWQTPGTDSFRSRGADRKDEMGLDQQARATNWKTPHGMSSNSGGGEFAKQANYWQTPIARDWKPETGSEHNAYDKTNLSRQVYSLQDRQTQAGPPSSESGQTSRRRLNPRFVEWLMGLPIGWTEP